MTATPSTMTSRDSVVQRPDDEDAARLGPERRGLLAEVAELYYVAERSQQEIADRFGVSRSTVSRLLAEARDRGVVQIRITRESARDEALEQRLREHLDVRATVVRSHLDSGDTIAAVGSAGARLLERALRPGGVLSLTHGSTVFAVMRALRIDQLPSLRMVQMAGFEVGNPLNDGWELIRLCFDRLESRYRYIHAPLLVASDDLHAALMDDPHHRETLRLARSADVALLGIGSVDPATSSLARGGILTSEALEEARARGSVGAINGFHYRLDGSLVEGLNDRIVGILPQEFEPVTRRIAVAVGAPKAAALIGAVRAGWLDDVVTDVTCADAVLDLLTQPARRATRTVGTRGRATHPRERGEVV